MWYQHILDVVNYSDHCKLHCGHVVHRDPDGGLNDIARVERRKARKTGSIVQFLLDGEPVGMVKVKDQDQIYCMEVQSEC
jgi:ribosomal protein L44E